MNRFIILAVTAIALCTSTLAVAGVHHRSKPEIGRPAPFFDTTDTNGKKVNTGALIGKVVVLEWTNSECPFVQKQYNSGRMQRLQKDATANGVVWISIISSAYGKEGYVNRREANEIAEKRDAHPTHIILDDSGIIGHEYFAKTTPHMFVIDKSGTLVYAGAIDNQPTISGGQKGAYKNFVADALAAIKDKKDVTPNTTNPYGCSIKY